MLGHGPHVPACPHEHEKVLGHGIHVHRHTYVDVPVLGHSMCINRCAHVVPRGTKRVNRYACDTLGWR